MLTLLRKFRLLFAMLFLCVAIAVYADTPAGCFNCGSEEGCNQGDNFPQGYDGCILHKDQYGTPQGCVVSGTLHNC